MSENQDHKQETWQTISFKKYVSPEEEKLIKKNKRLKRIIVISILFAIAFGWLGGSIFPYPNTSLLRLNLNGWRNLGSDKISSIMEVMESEWYFGKDIEDLNTRLTDQALAGITYNLEDIHTEYLTKEDVESFTQSINRNYVGIGVQYINVNDYAVIEKVFRDSPAEKAGVQVGDIIINIEGTDAQGLTSSEIKELVQGEEGTAVTITFRRGSEDVAYKIIRETLSTTTYGKQIDDVGYIQLYQFGESTPSEVKTYLEEFQQDHIENLIIDLRDNGGGYLTSVQEIAGFFLEKDSLVMIQEYKDGETSELHTIADPIANFNKIVILVNDNSASASEALTLALKQNLNNVTIVGTTTYGKGTAQITRYFDDGSALKFTTSKWTGPDGTWINEVGITPDEEVYQADITYHSFSGMNDGEVYATDSVAGAVQDMQMCLQFLGYDVDRMDGYFSSATQTALEQYCYDQGIESDGTLNYIVYRALYSSITYEIYTNESRDNQLQRGLEIVHG